MPLFRAQVNYQRGTNEKWSNVWFCTADDILTASVEWTVTGVPDLQPILDTTCSIVSVLISDPASDEFITVPINVGGSKSSSADLLPLFNSAKILIPTPGFGRPDLKYIKGNIAEPDQTAGVLTSGAQAELDGRLSVLISDMNTAGVPLVSHEGDPYTNVSVQPAVQMRQMHRKRRRSVPA